MKQVDSGAGGQPPVRVKLERVHAGLSKASPFEEPLAAWQNRLRTALGTSSDEFVDATIIQLQTAARLPNGGISEMALNSAIAIVASAEPRNEVEAALAAQMAATHAAAMAVLGRLGGAHGGDRHVSAAATAASRLLRSFSMQVETYRRLKHGGSQIVRVEHVHIADGAQAVIGNIGQ